MTLPKRSWRVGFLLGLCLTPIALLLALVSGGAGHGDYGLARLLYPIPMLATLLTNATIGGLAIGLAVLQFPAYGAFVGEGGRFRWLLLGIIHAAAVAGAFSGLLENFSG